MCSSMKPSSRLNVQMWKSHRCPVLRFVLTSWSVKQITAVALYLLVSRDAFFMLSLLSMRFALLLRGAVFHT